MIEKISVIVPIYIVDSIYLKECIESIINQTYKNIEIILVNDGMTPESYEYLKTLRDKRIKIIGDKNKGVSYARNLGIENAAGEYITFIDSDDYIEIDYCKKMLDKIKLEKADCVVCGYNRVYNDNKEVLNCDAKWKKLNSQEFLSKVLTVQSALGFVHMKLLKTNILKKNNINFNISLTHAEDAEFCVRLSKYINKIVKINEPLYNYRFNSESAVRKFDKEYSNKYLKSLLETKKNIDINNKELNQLYNNYVIYHVLLVIVNYCFHPNYSKKIKDKYKCLKEICNIKEYKEAIKKSNYIGLSFSRKITLFTVKYKLYIFTMVIALIRQKQFK